MKANVSLLKTEFREFCVSNLILRWIDDVFQTAGFQKAECRPGITGERRTLVEAYYASLSSWDSSEAIRKLLKVIEAVLRRSDLGADQGEHLRSLCTQAGFELDSDGFTIYFTSRGVGSDVKNLIFAANGPKPEIISCRFGKQRY
jgi:hypothetical protein